MAAQSHNQTQPSNQALVHAPKATPQAKMTFTANTKPLSIPNKTRMIVDWPLASDIDTANIGCLTLYNLTFDTNLMCHHTRRPSLSAISSPFPSPLALMLPTMPIRESNFKQKYKFQFHVIKYLVILHYIRTFVSHRQLLGSSIPSPFIGRSAVQRAHTGQTDTKHRPTNALHFSTEVKTREATSNENKKKCEKKTTKKSEKTKKRGKKVRTD